LLSIHHFISKYKNPKKYDWWREINENLIKIYIKIEFSELNIIVTLIHNIRELYIKFELIVES